jgi:hypothetical protein
MINILRYANLALIVIIAAIGALQTARLHTSNRALEGYKVAAAASAVINAKLTSALALNTKTYDEKYKAALSSFNDDVKRVRNERPRIEYLPAPASANDAATICFTRPELSSALERHSARLEELVSDCNRQVILLDTLRDWAQP